ncbi:MAG: hypothetical protein ABFC86_06085, partial [Rectinema sp.]
NKDERNYLKVLHKVNPPKNSGWEKRQAGTHDVEILPSSTSTTGIVPMMVNYVNICEIRRV